MKSSYLQRFTAMVESLQAHPDLRVTHFWVGAPVTDAEIGRVQDTLGYALAPSILDLYRQANGLQLRWLDTHSPFYVPDRDDRTVTERQTNLCGDDDPAIGVVDLLPLAECFVDRDWSEVLYFDWMREDEVTLGEHTCTAWELGRAMRPMDRFSFARSIAFYLQEGRAAPRLFLGEDHDATWSYSRPCDVETYLELVLQHRGAVAARRRIFRASRRQQGPVQIDPSQLVALTDLLPERHVFSPGDRVVFRDPYLSGDHRATVLSNDVGPTHPSGWDRSTRFVRVRADRGEVLLLSDPPTPLGAQDAYEEAMADVPAFVARLGALPPRQRFDILGAFALSKSSSTRFALTPLFEGAGPLQLSLGKKSQRFTALTATLPVDEAVRVWVQLIEDFLDDPEGYDVEHPAPAPLFVGDRASTTDRYSSLVEHLVCALAREIFVRAFAEAPFGSLRERFGDPLAERVGVVAERLGELRHNRGASSFSNTELLRAAVDRVPGVLPAPAPSRAYRGNQFGLDDLRIL